MIEEVVEGDLIYQWIESCQREMRAAVLGV